MVPGNTRADEGDAFPFQPAPLFEHAAIVTPGRQPHAGVDHPVPGQPAAGGKPGQGAAHQPGMAGHARQGGDLPVGRHPAPGNRGDDLPDPLLRSERLPGGLT